MSVSDGRVTLYIRAHDSDTWEVAQKIAERERRSLSFIVSEALDWYLSTMFDQDGNRVKS